jgi:hypothetical protein
VTELLQHELAGKAVEVAALLNQVVDDDERERLQEMYERRLNDELFHGSEVRAANAEVVQLNRVPIRVGARVRSRDGREGIVRAFRTERLWSYRERSLVLYALVDDGTGVPFPSCPVRDLTVIEGGETGVVA